MERNLFLELLEDGEKVSLYSPHFDGEEYTEFEKFLLKYKDSYPDDVRQLVYRLDIIKRGGAEDRHFRYEGTRRDRVMALPSHLETTSLRLYLLISSTLFFTNEQQTLQKIDIQMKQMENQKVITVKGTKLFGTLTFTIND